jgi:hypothetical protein
MIRLAISCDICGAEKKQTNHWFVAYEQAGELRISGWQSRYRKKSGARHLCGQTCLHKLCDEFMALVVTGDRAAAETAEAETGIAETGAQTGSAGPQHDPHGNPPQGPRGEARSYERSQTATGRPMDSRADHRLPDHRLPDPRWMENRAATNHVPTSHLTESRTANRTASSSYEDEFGSSARLISAPESAEEARRYASPEWRASAWERERQRERAAS